MRRSITALLLAWLLVLTGCGFGPGTTTVRRPTPTPTPVPKFCLGTFLQSASIAVGAAKPVTEEVQVLGPCVASTALKRGPGASVPASAGSAGPTIALQPYTNDFVARIDPPDPVTLPNCTGTTTLTQSLTVSKVTQSGLALGDTFYGSAPDVAVGNTLDKLAAGVFELNAAASTNAAAATYNFSLTAAPRTKVTVFLTWEEHLSAGVASLAQNSLPLVTSVYAIPTSIQFASTSQPQSASC